MGAVSGQPIYVNARARRAALVTPEAVAIDLPLADVGTRTLAILIDLFCLFTVAYLIGTLGAALVGVAIASAGGPGWLVIVIAIALNFAVFWGAPVAAEVATRGRTPGKAALGLRVVTTDGGPIRFRHAALRWLVALLEFFLLLGIPAILTALLNRRGQRLGDLAAGTVVIRDRGRRQEQPIAWHIPPPLAPYAATLDTSSLEPQDYALIRSFLLRAGTLPPRQRERVAGEVAGAMASRMRHVPPSGTHPEALLLCAAALMQQRDRAVAGQVLMVDPFAPAGG